MHALHLSFQLESLNILLGLQRFDGTLTSSRLKIPSLGMSRAPGLVCGLQANGLLSVLWLVMYATLFSVLPLISYLTLTQTNESLKICQSPNSLRFG